MIACEWEHDEDERAFVSVYTTGQCGGDSSYVCAQHFLDEVGLDAAGEWMMDGRWVEDWDDGEPRVSLVGEGRKVSVAEAIEMAKAMTGAQVVTHEQ